MAMDIFNYYCTVRYALHSVRKYSSYSNSDICIETVIKEYTPQLSIFKK
jgi:hypothetical protein